MFNILQQIATFSAVASMDFNINMAFYTVLKKEDSPCHNNTETCQNGFMSSG